jgi:hypothetical protein
MNGASFMRAVVAKQVKSVRITPTNTLQITLHNGQMTFLSETNTGKQFRFKTPERSLSFVSVLKVEVQP